MRVDVITATVIDRSVDEVYAFAVDPSNAPVWYDNIQSVDWKTDPRVEVGAQMALAARFLGRQLVYIYEITELVPKERLVMRTAEGPFPMETTYTWESIDDRGTRMTLRNQGQPAGFSSLMAPLMAPAMRRATRKDLARLKSILESPRQ